MKEVYRSDLKAHVTLDDDERVRAIRHSQEYWPSEQGSAIGTAVSYLRAMAGVYGVPMAQLARLQHRVDYLQPKAQDVEYRLADEKTGFDSTTLGFYQTYLNTPVWRAGLKVTLKGGPNRVIRSVDTSQAGIEVKMPPQRLIDRYTRLFKAMEIANLLRRAGQEPPAGEEEEEGAEVVREVTGLAAFAKRSKKAFTLPVRLIRGRYWIYQYDPEKRFEDRVPRKEKLKKGGAAPDEVNDQELPRPPLPPVSRRIKAGQYYLVAEITFELGTEEGQKIVWRALVELETLSVLYLRPLLGSVNGLVMEMDPFTETGDLTADHSATNAVLNPHRDDVTLQNLDAPVDGVQSLSGAYSVVTNVEGEDPAIPTEPVGTDFDYPVRTNDFAAVCAYFNVDRLFGVIADLGFDLATYFDGTTFPVPTDHRCFVGSTINAHCGYNGTGGIGHVGYGLMDDTDLTNPLGRACDPYVTWHELGGHGILFDNVDSGFFGFAHSAGDGLAAIFCDPESQLSGVDGTPVGKPGDLRFCYTPWHPTLNRRLDRDVTTGWAWGGAFDHGNSGYNAEQILGTTHFNIYRAIGGDSTHLSRRQFASRMMIYLILRAVHNLTPATNPEYAREFAAELTAVDLLNWTSEGVYGGAYNKVIRWAFEQQGEYQTPLVSVGDPADGTIVAPGDPPEVDVYIDDGRAGKYEFQQVHWNTTTIWNRQAAADLPGHQEPIIGATNYAYVKIKNRGTQTANNVTVKGYHTKPGAGLLWPGDFEAFTTAQIAVGTLGADNTEEKTVGPFEWTPNLNAYGHDCMLMVVSADGDPSNVDNFTIGEVIPEWRLVPNDNNVGQRNVFPVPGGGGAEGLMAGLDDISMWIGNPNPRRASMRIEAALPDLLEKAGWRLRLEGIEGKTFVLAPGEKREVVLKLKRGSDFTPDQVERSADRDVKVVAFADGNPLGGMTYRLDPKLAWPVNDRRPEDSDCRDQAKALLDCLGVVGKEVKKAKIKEIVVGVKMSDDDCC